MSYLNVTNVSHSFGGRQILENVSFKLLRGEHVGLVGANGEGKSTFLNIVTGHVLPDEGKVEWPGKVTVGISGKLSGHHMASLQFEKKTGTKLTLVTFTGAAPQVTALLGGHVEAARHLPLPLVAPACAAASLSTPRPDARRGPLHSRLRQRGNETRRPRDVRGERGHSCPRLGSSFMVLGS